MKKLRYFKCVLCNQVTEVLVKDDTLTVKCECNGEARRMLSAPRCFGNTTGGSPSTNYSKLN
jgi:predicted nucleic acid-binding Zn ribbon protein